MLKKLCTLMALMLFISASPAYGMGYVLIDGMFNADEGEVENEDLTTYGFRGGLWIDNPFKFVVPFDPGVVFQYRNYDADDVDFTSEELSLGVNLKLIAPIPTDLFQPYAFGEILVSYTDVEAGSESDDEYDYTPQIGAGVQSEIPGGLMLDVGVLWNFGDPDVEVNGQDFDVDSQFFIYAGLGFAF